MAKNVKVRTVVQRDNEETKKKMVTGTVTLDQDEVLKAMMAARKGKGRDDTPSDSESDSDNDGGDNGGKINTEEEEDEDDDTEEGASSSSRVRPRGSKRPRTQNNDDSVSDHGGPSSLRVQPMTVPLDQDNTSRVKLFTSKPQSTQPSKSPFNHPKAPSTTFTTLGLSPPLISALAGTNIRKPTEIQSACIEPILEGTLNGLKGGEVRELMDLGRDCIGGAKTGSGKTMAFALPIVERIARDPYGIWAVILTPTRELAYQLTEQFLVVGRPLGLNTVTIVGGMDMMAQARELEARPHIIVATPGRLCDLLRSDGMGIGKLGRVKVLVLDEADRLLTPTFAPELAYLFSQIPSNRQTCLFTATVSDAIMDLAQKPPQPGKQKPFVYRVESDTLTVAGLKQKYLFIPSQIRDPYLFYLLRHPPNEIDAALRIVPKKKKPSRGYKRGKRRVEETDDEEEDTPSIPPTIIFTQRCATAHLLHLLLTQLDVPSVPLHSHLTQPQRLESLARFRAREIPILVTTDVGSRGLDIPEVAMVINWDCPRRSDDYIHRVGRTARAGRGGVAVTVVTERDVELVQKIEKEIGVKMTEMELPEETVLESLNAVSLARRMATMEMHDTGFGERQATNKAKAIKRAKRDAMVAR